MSEVKKRVPNKWVTHLRKFSKENGISYAQAVSDKKCKEAYMASKNTPVVSEISDVPCKKEKKVRKPRKKKEKKVKVVEPIEEVVAEEPVGTPFVEDVRIESLEEPVKKEKKPRRRAKNNKTLKFP